MKRRLILLFILLFPAHLFAANSYPLEKANIDPLDNESLRRGALMFTNYCFNCHGASLMRYSRIGQDLGFDEAQLESQMIFTGAKVGDLMHIAMKPADSKRWFGVTPPDLSVIARSRGVNWIYTYLRSFYRDDTRPWGVNNALFPDVAMPHVLWELQGVQTAIYDVHTDEEGRKRNIISGFNIVESGSLSQEEFDAAVRDLVNFLHYMAEPTKQKRLAMGKWVLFYLVIFFLVMYLLKKEYWRDVSDKIPGSGSK